MHIEINVQTDDIVNTMPAFVAIMFTTRELDFTSQHDAIYIHYSIYSVSHNTPERTRAKVDKFFCHLFDYSWKVE